MRCFRGTGPGVFAPCGGQPSQSLQEAGGRLWGGTPSFSWLVAVSICSACGMESPWTRKVLAVSGLVRALQVAIQLWTQALDLPERAPLRLSGLLAVPRLVFNILQAC